MASFDLSLTLRTTDAIPALIRARTTDFEDLDARVLGDSENLQASLGGAAGSSRASWPGTSALWPPRTGSCGWTPPWR